MKTKLYTVQQFAKIYTAKHGGSCHRNNIYHLIKANNLPEGVKCVKIAGTTFIKVTNLYLENHGVTEID